MSTTAALAEHEAAQTASPGVATEVRWYAAYVSANHERCVAAELERRSVEQFVPFYTSVRRWKDRRVTLKLPLFPGYVFVRIALRDRLRVIQTPSVVRLVGFNAPAPLLDEEVETIRTGLSQNLRAEPHPFLIVGRRVRIISGPFTGLEGVLRRKKRKLRVVVSLDLIQRSIALDVDAADVVQLHA